MNLNKEILSDLRCFCPLPELMRRVGLGSFAKSSCRSPFRHDQTASWGIFCKRGRWKYKDFATGESGDEIGLLAHLHQLDPRKDFLRLLEIYSDIVKQAPTTANYTNGQNEEHTPDHKPEAGWLNEGTYEQLETLAALRGISMAGLSYAQERGVLAFGEWYGAQVYGVRDQSGCLVEIRRLDGFDFPASPSLPAHKSHTLKHSRKNWPLGILEAADCPGIALVEGLPDFLAMHQFVLEEGMVGKVSPVAMLSASCEIAPEALPYFKDKHVRIFPHHDLAGIDGAERWQKQLISANAKRVDFFNFHAFEFAAEVEVKDLCDFNQQRGLAGTQQQQILESIII